MGKPAVSIDLSEEERRALEGLARRRRTARGLAQRARIVRAAAGGLANKAIAARLEADPKTVAKWRRFGARSRRAPGRASPRRAAPDRRRRGRRDDPADAGGDAARRDARVLARATGLAPSTIHRIWKAFGLRPHQSETYLLSTGPFLVEKLRDIAGLHPAPPERAAVLSVDEKSRIQALDRTQPLLALRPSGRAAHARLPALRDALALRRARRGGGPGDRPLLSPPPRARSSTFCAR
jgi:hypothetical protein